MSDRADVVYIYDGSFDGLLCCIFESFSKHEIPADIIPMGSEQFQLFDTKEIETDSEKAKRVYLGIKEKISSDAQTLAKLGFLTCLPDKEMVISRFIIMGFRIGGKITGMLTNDTVSTLTKAVRFLLNESHLLKGFIRFTEYGQVLVSEIEPKNEVLPVIAAHFSTRFSREKFMIYDKTHKQALVYEPCSAKIFNVDDFRLPAADVKEDECKRMWRMFYDTIAVEGRTNPKCRMSHMPKRYWGNMTEFENRITDLPE
ncbi:MAG: TIGR03915 family putative DNA repair protein [Bacillota bacterium]|nr:TIGR03915 family putative DNA repair protein [Bacillota bacterium]